MLTRVRDREGGYDTGRTHIRATEAVAPAHAAAVVVVAVAADAVHAAVLVVVAGVVGVVDVRLAAPHPLTPRDHPRG